MTFKFRKGQLQKPVRFSKTTQVGRIVNGIYYSGQALKDKLLEKRKRKHPMLILVTKEDISQTVEGRQEQADKDAEAGRY